MLAADVLLKGAFFVPAVHIKVHKVRLVVPKPGTALQVNSIQPAGGSTATVHTAQPHAFSGATQLASLTGLPCELDGTYPVIASGKKKSRTQLEIELFKGQPSEKRAALEEEVQQAVGAGSVAVRCAWRERAGQCGVTACRQLHAFRRCNVRGLLVPLGIEVQCARQRCAAGQAVERCLFGLVCQQQRSLPYPPGLPCSENYMLDDSMEILYFRLADDAAEDAAAVGAAAEDDTAGAEPAAEPAVAAVAAQDAAAAPAAPMLLAGAVQPLPQGILVPVPLTDPELPNEELDAPAEWWLD